MKNFRQRSKLKKLLFRPLYKIGNPLRVLFWFIVRPNTRGVKCLIEHEGEILLVRLSYAHKTWALPGGGVKRGEQFIDAARRETLEETGIDIKEWRKVGEYSQVIEYKNDMVECFYATTDNPGFVIDGMEIAEARWCDPRNLPEAVRPHVERIIQMAGLL